MAKRKYTDNEGPIQRDILHYLRMQYPRAAINHSPNEFGMNGKAVARQIAKARSLGTCKGWPDLEVLHEGQLWFFEVKAPGNYATPEQKAVGALIEGNGGRWAVVRSVDEAKAQIALWQASTDAVGHVELRGQIV